MGNYLSHDEQFKKILNDGEISRIEDNELRYIRQKYWHLYRKVFLDEHGIPDSKLDAALDRLWEAESRELNEYKQKHGIE